jgi:DNA-binding CsgD family transcriptional regulator/catechol 2,3-dioxygenase-like lactoylglutathione lyase family enzyme
MRERRSSRRGRPPHADVLTPAEWRVVHAVQHGLSYAEIAARLHVSRDAVKFHVTNAVAKLGVGDRRGLRRWFRAPAASALARKEQTMTAQAGSELGPIAQVARTVRDIEESTRWYGQTLGLKHLYSFGSLAFFELGGTRLLLSAQKTPAPESILYFRVAEIRSAYEIFRGRGVQFAHAPHLIHRHADGTEEWLASFTDPEERPLALLCQVKPAVASGP